MKPIRRAQILAFMFMSMSTAFTVTACKQELPDSDGDGIADVDDPDTTTEPPVVTDPTDPVNPDGGADPTPTPVPTATPTPTPPPATAKLPEGTKICVIGDAGSGGSGQVKVAAKLAVEGCNYVIYVGDVIYEEGLKNADDAQFKTKYYNHYKPLIEGGVPFFMIMGNHDYGKNPGAWLDIAKRYPEKIIFPNYYYKRELGDLCLIGVDTNINDDSKQKTWIDSTLDDLDRRKACKFVLSFGHHPYVSSGEYGTGESDVRSFLDGHLLGRTDLHLSGHDHILSDELTRDGTRLIVSGGGGQGLYEVMNARPGAFAKSVPGYVTLTFTHDGEALGATYQMVQILNGVRTIIHTGLVNGAGVR